MAAAALRIYDAERGRSPRLLPDTAGSRRRTWDPSGDVRASLAARRGGQGLAKLQVSLNHCHNKGFCDVLVRATASLEEEYLAIGGRKGAIPLPRLFEGLTD
jgi:hypothetical protein